VQVGHCAAGVRWLRHLHAVALSGNAVEQTGEHAVHLVCSRTALSHRPASSSADTESRESGNVMSSLQLERKLNGCCVSESVVQPVRVKPTSSHSPPGRTGDQSASHHLDTQHAVNAKGLSNCCAIGGVPRFEGSIQSTPACGEQQDSSRTWQETAREFATVQEWFCFLVRSHFKVSIQRFCSMYFPTADALHRLKSVHLQAQIHPQIASSIANLCREIRSPLSTMKQGKKLGLHATGMSHLLRMRVE
jgi:hypothetical protein